MVPTAWMLHATVERRIIRNRYRLKSKARVIFDADHGRIDFDKRLKKPIVIAIDVDGKHAKLWEFRPDEVEIVQC